MIVLAEHRAPFLDLLGNTVKYAGITFSGGLLNSLSGNTVLARNLRIDTAEWVMAEVDILGQRCFHFSVRLPILVA